jgi:hypothetical protein
VRAYRFALVLLLCVVACVGGGVSATAAVAYGDANQVSDPAAWSNLSNEDQNALLEFLSRGTPAESMHYATTADEQVKAQALEDAYNASRPDDAKAALTADAGAAAQQAKFVPSLDAIHSFIAWPIAENPVTALITLDVLLIANDATYVMRMADHDIPNPLPAGAWTTASYRYFWHNGGSIYSPPAPQTLPAGVYAEHIGQNSFSSGDAWSDDDPYPRTAPPYPLSDGQRIYWDETHGNWDVDGHYLPQSFEYFLRVSPGDRPFHISERPRRATPSDSGPSAPWGAPPDPNSNLDGSYGDPGFGDLRNWACHVLGHGCPDPYQDYHMTPDCSGLTYEGCASALRDAGFTGKIDEEHLTSDDAYMEGAPGKVTTTRPGPNFSIVEDREFEIFINPDPMPSATPTEQSIAAQLKAANPDVVTDDIALTLARQCVRSATAGAKPTSDCLNLPIFVTGDDAGTPARSDIAALAGHPQWFELNHREDIPRKQWWKKSPPPADGCVKDVGDNMTFPECHEFPFWSTLQAYGGTLQTAVPQIQWAPRIENGRQGTVLRQFYSSNSAGGSVQFAGCSVPGQSQYDTTPARGSAFLNLPLPPAIPFASTGICNRAARGL